MTIEAARSTVPFWIGGRETASRGSRHAQVTNSATGEAVRAVPFATSDDIDLAVDSAWKDSLFGDLHVHGVEGVKFYTRTKVITKRWPEAPEAVSLTMPTMK